MRRKWLFVFAGIGIAISLSTFDYLNQGVPTSFKYLEFHAPPLEEGFDLFEVCPIDLKSDGKIDFLVLTINKKNPDLPAPVIIYHNTGLNSWRVEKNEEIKFFHPRNCRSADFNGDGFPDLIVSDHGPDHEPFPGAYPRIIFSDSSGQLKFAPPEFFNTEKIFNFGVEVADFNSDGKPDIFLVNIYRSQPLLFLNAKFKKMELHQELLPSFIKTLEKKFLGVAAIDINSDHKTDLVLGGHGGKSDNENFKKDVVLFNTREGLLEESLPQIFPDRLLGSDVSSVEIVSADFNHDNFMDFAVLYHKVGLMTDGYVDFYENQKGTSFRRMRISKEYKKPAGVNNWFARGVSYPQPEGNGDDLIIVTRTSSSTNEASPSLIYYHNTPLGFKADTEVFKSVTGGIAGLAQSDLNGDGVPDLIFVKYDASVVSAIRQK